MKCALVAALCGCSGDDGQGGPVTPSLPATPPEISLSTSSLSFQVTMGGPRPASQTVSIGNARTGTLAGLTVSIAYSGAQSGWLTAALSGATAPATLTVGVEATLLPVGTHTATVNVGANGASNSPQGVAVTLTVVAPPAIRANPSSVSFTAVAGGSTPAARTVAVTNGGGGTISGLTAAVSYSGASGWLTAALSADTAPATLTLTADISGRAAGSYAATVVLSAGGSIPAAEVGVQLTLSAPPPPPPPPFPLSAGKKWRYLLKDSTRVVSNGVTTSITDGELILHALDQGQLGGRSAWRLHAYELGDVRSAQPALQASTIYLATDATGLLRFTGGSWRRVLSSTSSRISGGTLLLGGVPQFNGDIALTPGTVTVPAGSFATTTASQYHREGYDRDSPEEKLEIRLEHFAAGVGSVFAQWTFEHERNLEQTSIRSQRTVTLTHVDAGPFPTMIAEGPLPHASPSAATLVEETSLVFAEILQGDASTTLTDAGVGCSTVCIEPNSAGQKRLEDWYRLTVPRSTGIRIELDYPVAGENDIDLYLFQEVSGRLRYAAASRSEGGEREMIRGTVGAGTWYIALQAWDTPAGRSPYWLSVRSY